MMKRWVLWLGIVTAAGISSPVTARNLGSLTFSPCSLSAAFSGQALEAQCTQFKVAENPADPNSRQISLSVAWIPAVQDERAEPDPVLMIAGGPGQSALESYPQVAGAFAEINKKRHIFLIDQRGTGNSNSLACPSQTEDENKKNAENSLEHIKTTTKQCLEKLKMHADVRFYTTTEAISDLELFRQAIKAPQLNLVGISYGTRVAQQFAATYPNSTRSLVLDGVAPNSLVLGNEFAVNMEDSLKAQFALCEKIPVCQQRFGDPYQQLQVLLKQIKANPPLVSFRDGITGEYRQERLTRDTLTGLVRMYSYMPLAASLLPLQLNEAAQGRFDGLMALAGMLQAQMQDNIAMGMQLSVICSEDAADMKLNPADASTLLGAEFLPMMQAQCSVWEKGKRPEKFRQPLTGNLPVLLMSGEFDPVTPPRYGDEVAKNLPNSRHFVLQGQGHNVMGSSCMPRLMAKFIETNQASALDADCLKTLPRTPPFTGFYGWEP